jgi:hypothetical protein
MTDPVKWLAQIPMVNEAIPFRIGTAGDEVIAEWTGLARLVALRDGSRSELIFEPGADPRVIEKIRRGSAFLLLRELSGSLALHGAAVVAGGKAAVLLGRSGQGKSTLAAALCRAGAALLADDAVALEPVELAGKARWNVLPQEADHWLDADALRAIGGPPLEATGKVPVASARVAEHPVAVACFIELRFGGERPSLARLHGVEAALGLVPQIARFILDDPERQRRELDLIHRLVDEVPCFALERPRAYERLDETVELLRREISALDV